MDQQATATATGGANVAPTLGAAVGVPVGILVAHKLGLNPGEIDGGGVVTLVGALVTAMFHWIGVKTGIPGLG